MTIKSKAEELQRMKERGLITPTPAAPANQYRPPLPPIGTNQDLTTSQSPSSYSTIVDQLRATETNAIPSVRIPPAPALANQGANASSGSYTDRVVQPVFSVSASAASNAASAVTTANAAQSASAAASSTAAAAQTGVNAIGTSTAIAIISGVMQQIPINTLGHVTTTPTLDNLNDGSTYNRVLATALNSGAIDSTKPGFLAKGGSTVPQIVGTTSSIISYTTTTTTATISWSSFTVFFADGTSALVSSGSQGVTGLTASTTYYLYGYLNSSNVVTFAAVSGGVGTPAILYNPQSPTAAQAANLQGVSALSTGGIQVITPSSGSSGGHGGGSGLCLRAGQYIESKTRGIIAIEDVEVGDFIQGRTDWTKVLVKRVVPQSHFVRITLSNGERISLTPSHCTTAIRDGEEQPIRAANLNISDFLILRDGYASIKSLEHLECESHKVSITCEPEHEFYASESKSVSILVHNVQIPS